MKVLRQESHQSTPTIWPKAERLDNEWESVIIELQDVGPYDNRLVVKLKMGDETIDRYEFEVPTDEYRRCRPKNKDIPLIILHYVANFGYYVEGSENGPWGQYEYVIDAAGRFEDRTEKINNPIIAFLFDYFSAQFELLSMELPARTHIQDYEFDLETIVNKTEIPDMETAELVHGKTELNKLPISERTRIPTRLRELDIGPKIESDREEIEGVDVSIHYDQDENIIATVISHPGGAKYFRFNGKLGGNCSLEFTGRNELPGIFIEDYLETEFDTTVVNTPRIHSSDSELEILHECRALLDNIRETDGLRINLDGSLLEDLELSIAIAEMFIYLQKSVGEDRFLAVVDDVCRERADGLAVDDLAKAPPRQFQRVVMIFSLAAQKLDTDEKEDTSDYLERQDLDTLIDPNSGKLDEYARLLADEL